MPARSAGRFGRGAQLQTHLRRTTRQNQAPPFRTARPYAGRRSAFQAACLKQRPGAPVSRPARRRQAASAPIPLGLARISHTRGPRDDGCLRNLMAIQQVTYGVHADLPWRCATAGALASPPGGLSMRMQGGKDEAVGDAARPPTRGVGSHFFVFLRRGAAATEVGAERRPSHSSHSNHRRRRPVLGESSPPGGSPARRQAAALPLRAEKFGSNRVRWRTIAHSTRNSLFAMLRWRRAVVFPASFSFRL